MKISEKVIAIIKSDSKLRAKLMLADGKSEYSIKRWIENNDEKLTMPKYTSVISEHTGLDLTEVIEEDLKLEK